jgi:hypothetical protein
LIIVRSQGYQGVYASASRGVLYGYRHPACDDAFTLVVVDKTCYDPLFLIDLTHLPIPQGIRFVEQLINLRGY